MGAWFGLSLAVRMIHGGTVRATTRRKSIRIASPNHSTAKKDMEFGNKGMCFTRIALTQQTMLFKNKES